LEESVEKTPAKLVAHPFFEVARVAHRKEPGFKPGENAKERLENAELQECLERFERVSEKFSAVKNPRRARTLQHVVRQNFRPQVFDRLRFGEKTMGTDVEVKTFVGGRARNAAHVNRIGFPDRYIDLVLGKQVGGSQSR